MLAAEQLRRPTLTLAKLWVELSLLYKRVELPRAKEWYAPGESDTLTTYSPVPLCATMDGVDVKFEASVVVDVFHMVYVNSNNTTSTTSVARRVLRGAPCSVHPFARPDRHWFSAFDREAVQTGAVLKLYQIDLHAANGKTIKTFGLAEHVQFQLGGYELETNFVVVDDAMGVEDFLLGLNFLRAYQELVDLTWKKIVVRAAVRPMWHHAHTQVGDSSLAVPVTLDSDLVF